MDGSETGSANFYGPGVIVSLHVATGAAAGAALGSRRAAVPVGVVLHFLGDVMPHRDIVNRRFEMVSGGAALALVAARRGLLDSATIGAVAASVPDVEHVIRLPRPGGRKLFPTHRWRKLHQSGGMRAGTQLVAAGILLGLVVSARAPARGARDPSPASRR